MNSLAIAVFVLAAIPALLFLVNLAVYRVLPRIAAGGRGCGAVSVLIPARDEARVIGAAVESVLASEGIELEVLVLDDQSTDDTAAIVEGLASRDSRVRLLRGSPLPPGWCGKQHACFELAREAAHPWLVFMDADVRLTRDALARMVQYVERRGVPLASGVPRQRLETFSEKLLLPLIHFVLLGFLPMHGMRRLRAPAFSAGCGQLFIANAGVYRQTGGHARIRASLHDGLQLPRVFRRAGHTTDLFDATDVAECRMYWTNTAVWQGLAKNATEGLGAPGRIVPMTLLLLGGALMPWVLLGGWSWLGIEARGWALAAAALSWLPRLVAVGRFQQPIGSALMHPLGVVALVGIQWHALIRSWVGRPKHWKGRVYPATEGLERV
jgi:hypothetical protein